MIVMITSTSSAASMTLTLPSSTTMARQLQGRERLNYINWRLMRHSNGLLQRRQQQLELWQVGVLETFLETLQVAILLPLIIPHRHPEETTPTLHLIRLLRNSEIWRKLSSQIRPSSRILQMRMGVCVMEGQVWTWGRFARFWKCHG